MSYKIGATLWRSNREGRVPGRGRELMSNVHVEILDPL
jgi:hypothetical protein